MQTEPTYIIPSPEAVTSMTVSVPHQCPGCAEKERGIANLNTFIREIQRREDATVAFYRGRREIYDALLSMFHGPVRAAIEEALIPIFTPYKPPPEFV